MATGVGFSFDTSFLKNLEKADAKMASLMDKSNQASRSIVSAFQQMDNQGVVPFVQSLEKQKQTLDSVFDAITTKTGKARKGYEGMASSVIDATNALVSLISKMKSTSQYQHDTKLTGLSAQIKELQEYQERQRQVKVASAQAMNAELDKYRQLIERVRELNSIKAQAKEVKTTSTDSELVRDANKAQREANAELRTLKEQQKQIEQKYAVETALIRKQADAQSFKDKASQAAAATKAVEAEIKKEQDAYLKSLSEKIKAQQEYAQRMKELEQARLRQQSANRRASYKLDVVGGTGMNAADQALRYADRIYSDRGVRSINNMQKAIHQMKEAQSRLNLDTEEGKKKYEQLSQRIKTVQNDINRATNASEEFNKKQKGVLDTAGQLKRALAAAFSVSAIRGYVNKLVAIRGEFEMQQRSLQVLLQNKDEANALWDKTVALAVKSPFTTKQLVTYTKQLAAYRVESEKLYETNKMLADVSAGLGVDMNRLILAFGQVKAANFLRGTELRQFSEAGVNMLDELAKRFTALEGRAVSVGEVFERVSKRMVSFKDVESVFKTITSEGGVFYQMQEKQSETLKGLRLNLKDSYELMLNEIGESNEGLLKGFVSVMKSLVDNWGLVAEAIKAAGIAIVLYKVQSINSVAAANTSLLKSQKLWQLLRVNMRLFGRTVKGVFSTVTSNPWLLVITAAITAVTKLYGAWREHQEQIEEINKQYSELREKVQRISVKFAYAKESNKQREELQKLIDIANNELNMGINIDIKGLDEGKIKALFSNLREQIVKTQLFATNFAKSFVEQTWDFSIYDDIRSDFKDLGESSDEFSSYIQGNLYKIIDGLQQAGKYSKEMKDAFAKQEYNESDLEYIERILNGYKSVQKEVGKVAGRDWNKVFGEGFASIYMNIDTLMRRYKEDLEEAEKEFDKFIKNIDIDPNLSDEEKTIQLQAAIDTAKSQENWNSFVYEYVKKWTAEAFVGVSFKPIEEDEQKLEPWAERVTEEVNKINAKIKAKNEKVKATDLFPLPEIGQTKEQYLNLAKDVIKIGRATYTKNQQIEEQSQVNRTKLLKDYVKSFEDVLNITHKGAAKEESKELKLLKEKIKFVRQLADDYEEMWKKYGKAYADANIKSDARRAAATELKLDIDKLQVGTRQEEKTNLRNLLPDALGIEGGKVEIEKAVADVEVEVRWDLQEQANANLSREFENLFGNYELSLELEKLNIPPDLAEQLFGIDSIDLTTLRKELLNKVGLGGMAGKTNAEILNSDAYKKLNTHQQKELANHLQKVTDMEKKAQEEMLKNYSKYLVQAQSERVKILLEQQRMLEEIASLHIGDEDKALMREGVEKEIQKKLQHQAWKDFQDSGMYLRLFENLEGASMQSLDTMETKLKELRDSLTELDPTELKEINNQLEKIQGLKVEKNPFKDLKEDATTFFEYLKNKKGWEKRLAENEAKESYLKKKVDEEQLGINKDEKDLAAKEKAKGKYDNEVQTLADKLALRKANLKILLDDLEVQGKINKAERKRIEGGEDAKKSLKDRFSEAAKYATGIASSLGDMTESLESVFGMSDGLKDTLQVIQGVGMGLGDILNGAAGIMSGNPLAMIQGGMSAISGVAKIIGSFNEAYDKKKERQIQVEIKLVERLQKVYDDLGETIENTYSMDTLNQATKMSKKNLDEQIAATERMIQAEYDKKDTDHERIEDWKEEIEDAKKALKELNEQSIEEKGGFGGEANRKSAATAFVDAWLQAYKETGDGLSGLNEQFDEFYEDFVKKQLLLGGVDKYLENFFNKFDTDISKIATPADAEKVAKEIITTWDGTAQNLDSLLRTLAENLGLSETLGAGTLGGLQKGIQGITTEQADVLTAYWSSVRMYTAENNSQLKTIVAALTQETPSPMLNELRNIAQHASDTKGFVQEIRDLLNSLTVAHPTETGRGFKVVI